MFTKANNPSKTLTCVSQGSIPAASVISPINGNLYEGTIDAGIYSSTDNGLTWNSIGPIFGYLTSAIVGIGSKIIANNGQGIYYSPNNGKNWTSSIYVDASLAISVSGGYILAGGRSGIFRSPLP